MYVCIYIYIYVKYILYILNYWNWRGHQHNTTNLDYPSCFTSKLQVQVFCFPGTLIILLDLGVSCGILIFFDKNCYVSIWKSCWKKLPWQIVDRSEYQDPQEQSLCCWGCKLHMDSLMFSRLKSLKPRYFPLTKMVRFVAVSQEWEKEISRYLFHSLLSKWQNTC